MKEKLLYVVLKGVALLPLWLLYGISDFVFLILYYLTGYRKKVVRDNLVSSFPNKDLKEIKKIEHTFYRYLCDLIVETLKLLSISDAELKRRIKVINYEAVNDTLRRKRSAVLFLGHYCNWEWVQEICQYFIPEAFKCSIYHPLNDGVWNELFLKLRGRWGNHLIEMKNAPRVLLNKDHQPWVCGFIADAWTFRKNDFNEIDFLNHATWFIYGSEDIGKKAGSDFFYLEMKRVKRGYYEINFHPLQPQDMDVAYPYTRDFWRLFEKTIEEAPAYWLWSHKRWK